MSTLLPRGPLPDAEAHARLRELLDVVTEAVGREDWESALESLERFVIAFEHHLHYEEDVLFPLYALSSLAVAGEIETLRRQHHQLRKLAGKISLACREHHTTVAMLSEFDGAWALHDQCEARAFHHWLREYAEAAEQV